MVKNKYLLSLLNVRKMQIPIKYVSVCPGLALNSELRSHGHEVLLGKVGEDIGGRYHD